ncbi:MAG: ATP synthase F1 subunit delta [Bacteroidetes bacterium]|nr:ATP synthase F1 subunit delta [Saprospirales bacterium]RME08421.1 MAG: ATP synthase F1 subunit delta [Bacteroidota bacterium]
MSAQRIASRYARSLIEVAQEKGKLERVLEDIKAFDALSKVRDFYLLLKSPVIKADKKKKILEAILGGKFDDLTMQFINILLRKGREAYLSEIANEFIQEYKRLKNITTVKVTSAVKLDEKALNLIRQKLAESAISKGEIELVTKVNPNLIGGLLIEFDGKQYDSSVARKLNELHKQFEDNLYISQIIAS